VNTLPKNILFVYNQVSKKYKYGLFRECTLDSDVSAIREALIKTKCNVLSLDLYNPQQLDDFIAGNQPIDFAFVLAEGYKDFPHTFYSGYGASRVREQLKKHRIPASHSSVESMEICRNKDFTYKKLHEKGISVPNFFVFDSHCRFRKKRFLSEIERIGYPLMIKPAGGGDSIGITPKSVVYNINELKNKIEYLKKILGPEKLIIEKYLPGQEFTISILGSETKYILPIVAFPEDWGIRYTRTKNKEHRMQNKFKIIDQKHPIFSSLVDISVKSFIAVKASDVIRIDVKKDTNGKLYVIDINGTPALSVNGSITFMGSKVGLSHSQLIKIIFYESMVRNNLAPNQYLEELIEPLKKIFHPHKEDKSIEVFSEDIID
jgi:D-alanine-D-alanine ligase